jgi:hypothetical protein
MTGHCGFDRLLVIPPDPESLRLSRPVFRPVYYPRTRLIAKPASLPILGLGKITQPEQISVNPKQKVTRRSPLTVLLQYLV